MDWELNDIRHFLAVARTGSTLAAARHLGVNQTTSARRIAALEQNLGLVLFDRSANGYRLSASGTALVSHAEAIEEMATQFYRKAKARAREEQAEIRFSTSDVLAELIAGPAVAAFARMHPGIKVVFTADSRPVDLTSKEADVALRAAPAMDDPNLVVRKVMDTPWGFYRAMAWPTDRASPREISDVAAYPLATLEGRPAALLNAAIPGANIRYASNSMKALVEVIKSGECIGALPILIGERDPALSLCFVLPVDAGGLWIVFHERVRNAPHIRTFIDHLAAFIEAWRVQASMSRAEQD